ncbi:translation-associated GTPase [Capsaspora owczarzaki ATCC 30864]|uniref:Translation-associated GTPase n=2 Tax=Capsaspora owczarzaki (strain ATCC 30864) TaxID=595528 RepID=A0A0D2WVS7_CAPO3|nr:translation-associated GTPase [Capsaspora owczarzaki ATCC 30864]
MAALHTQASQSLSAAGSPSSSASSKSASVRSLEVGILGMPNVGKSSLFNALSGGLNAEASNFPFCTINPNFGVLKVDDKALATIAQHIATQRVVQAEVRIVDIAGLVKGASQGAGLGNKFLSHVRQVDALMHVVRCFPDDEITHVDGEVNPLRDLETIEMELVLADLQTMERMLARAKPGKRSWLASVPQATVGTLKLSETDIDALMQRAFEWLNNGKPIRSLLGTLPTPEERDVLQACASQLLTVKPMIYIANVDESQAMELASGRSIPQIDAVKAKGDVIPVCVKTEMDLLEVESKEERLELLSSLGMAESAGSVISRRVYDLLGLQSFYTAGEQEIKAWSILKGSTAVAAAGRIHTDFMRTFIKAETYSVADLEEYKTEAAVKAAGKMRSEGKGYIVQPNDIMHFLLGR